VKVRLGLLGVLLLGLWAIRAFQEEPEEALPEPAAEPEQQVVPTRAGTPVNRTLEPRERSAAQDPAGRRVVADPAEAPFRTFASRAAPRWQGLSLELRRLGHDDLADETWSMAAWIRGQRQDPERDSDAILEAQDDLLGRVEALPDLDDGARVGLEVVRQSVEGFRGASG